MTENQKKLALIVGTIVIALLLLMKRGGGTIVNQSDAPPMDVTIPSNNIPERTPIVITIPGLPGGSQYDYNAVSPCMCNGTEITNGNAYNGPLLEFITNQGSQGANTYNYNNIQAPAPTPSWITQFAQG